MTDTPVRVRVCVFVCVHVVKMPWLGIPFSEIHGIINSFTVTLASSMNVNADNRVNRTYRKQEGDMLIET